MDYLFPEDRQEPDLRTVYRKSIHFTGKPLLAISAGVTKTTRMNIIIER